MFLGFVDNWVTYLDGEEVHSLDELNTLAPDVVVVASQVHAGDMTR